VLREIRLGTRGSRLALWQAEAVAGRIAAVGGPPCRIVTIKTSGDRLQDASLASAGGKRLFVKEIEDALLKDEIDIAVHSSKDMPVVLPQGLVIGGVLAREDPLDAVVLPLASATRGSRSENSTRAVSRIDELVSRLGRAPSIGTSSVRRVAQLTRIFPGGRFVPIRGNLDTRLRKLDEGAHDALVLAAAGLRRLGFGDRIGMALPATVCVPAPGQGIVAIEAREDNEPVLRALAQIDAPQASAALRAERAVVVGLGGGCQTPIGALALASDDGDLELVAAVVALDGSRVVRAEERGPIAEPEALGSRVGAQLVAGGAEEILAEARRTQTGTEQID
jgi:hydroxymethylbilane synthase